MKFQRGKIENLIANSGFVGHYPVFTNRIQTTLFLQRECKKTLLIKKKKINK